MSSRLMVNDLRATPAAPHETSRTRGTSLVTRVETRVTRCQDPRYAWNECLFPRYGPPLRVERVPVPEVRTPVTRGTGACSRGTDPRYAMSGCPCAMPPIPVASVCDRRSLPPRPGCQGEANEEAPRTSSASTLSERRYKHLVCGCRVFGCTVDFLHPAPPPENTNFLLPQLHQGVSLQDGSASRSFF
jgi:hypothetical protein